MPNRKASSEYFKEEQRILDEKIKNVNFFYYIALSLAWRKEQQKVEHDSSNRK